MVGPIKKRALPKRNRNEDLETTSTKQLYDVFPIENFEIREIPRRDKGVDSFIELKSSDNHLGIEFIVQLKATRRSSGKNYHSKSIETSNLEYLLNHPQPAIYILYVEESQTYYYEWAEEFARRLAEKDAEWDIRSSHTLRFQRVLNLKEAEIIYSKVLRDGEDQRRERDFVIQGDLQAIVNSMHDEKESHGGILAAFKYLFDKCSGLSVLPMHVIERVPPFANSLNSSTHYSEDDSILRTDSTKLISFFENLTKKKNRIILNPNEDESDLRQSVKSKLIGNILNFFYRNAIHHLGNIPEKSDRKRICIHKLYISGSCNCERCKYYRLDFQGALEKVVSAKPKSPYELLRNAHTLMEVGDFKESYSIYEKLIQSFRREKNFVSYFMCKYNLSRAYGLFRWNYFHNDRASVLKEIKQINLDDEIYLLQKRHKVKDEIILVLKWISHGDFITYAHRQLDEKLAEIRTVHRNDKLGGWTSADHTLGLLKLFQETTDFVEFNLIMYDVIGGYSSFIDRSFDGILMLYDLQSEHNNALKGFTADLLKRLLLQGSANRLDESLSKYRIASLKFDPTATHSKSTFKSYVDNFIGSLDSINQSVNINKKSPNHFLSRKVNDVIKNLCVLLSVVEFSPSALNIIINQLLDKFESCEFIERSTIGYLVQIVNRKVKVLHPELLERMYILSLTHERMDIDIIKTGMPGLFIKYFPDYHMKEAAAHALLSLVKENEKSRDLTPIIHFWRFANPQNRNQIREFVIHRLQSLFEFEIYYLAVTEGVIDYSIFWTHCLKAIPITEGEQLSESLFLRRKRTRNKRLNLLVEIALKNELNLQDDIFQNIIPDEPFYKWLFHLNTFDYKNFKPMWLLEFHSSHFFEEFKKHPQIREALKPVALKNNIPELTKIYLKHFCGEQILDTSVNSDI